MPFSASLDDATALRKALAVVAELVEAGNFVASPSGLWFQGMDASHVALVTLTVPSSSFEDFVVDSEVVFGARLDHFSRVLGCSTAGGAVRLSVGSDVATFDFPGASFTVKLIDLDSDRVDVPPSDPDVTHVTLDLDAAAFQRAVKDLAAFGDVVTFRAEGGSVRLDASGDVGTASVRADDLGDVAASGDLKAQFALRYLSTFAKAASASPRVRLALTESMPLETTFDVLGGKLTFHLAPKIDDDAE